MFSLNNYRYTKYFEVFNNKKSVDKFRFNLLSESKNTGVRVEA